MLWFFLLAPVVFLVSGVYSPLERKRARWRRYLMAYAHVHLMVLGPTVFLCMFDSGAALHCCTDDVFFAPQARLTVYAVLLVTWGAYFYALRATPGPPLLEILVNVALIVGLVFSVFVAIHLVDGERMTGDNPIALIFGDAPIVWLLVMRLVHNHRRNLVQLAAHGPVVNATGLRRVLRLPLAVQFPLFLVLAAPFMALLSALLVLFGQQPDAVVRAFRDTYHHGLSVLTPACLNVDCDGHYLCTVAARGHRGCVRPLRFGCRGGRVIVCNRQLLVANAFEEIVKLRFPALHRKIRDNYDRVGRVMVRHYHWFRNPWLSDAVYLAMKPAEYLFLAVIYLHDTDPEQRIDRQYSQS